MTKKQEPQMICKKGHTLPLEYRECNDTSCPDYEDGETGCIYLTPHRCIDSRSLEDIEQCCGEQPTQMPLLKCAKGITIRCSICEEIKPDDDGRCVYLQTQQAHDSEVAAQARKRTLKYVEATLERAFVNLSPIEQGVLNICLAHIRAMAEKE